MSAAGRRARGSDAPHAEFAIFVVQARCELFYLRVSLFCGLKIHQIEITIRLVAQLIAPVMVSTSFTRSSPEMSVRDSCIDATTRSIFFIGHILPPETSPGQQKNLEVDGKTLHICSVNLGARLERRLKNRGSSLTPRRRALPQK